MERNMEDIMPVCPGEGDFILSKQGDYTIGFRVTKPEIFSMSGDDYEALHQALVRALKILPAGSVFHMTDWFITKYYRADFDKAGESFFNRASDRFFNERPYLDHACYLFLTKKPKGRRTATTAASSLLRRSIVPDETLSSQAINEYNDCCGQFQRILEDSGYFKLTRLTASDLWSTRSKAGIVEQYCSLSVEKSPVARDVTFQPTLKIGEQECCLFTLGDAADLPAYCGPRINYDKYSTDKTKFSIGFSTVLGQLLPCNHIYNQFIFILDTAEVVKKMEAKRLRLQSLSAYSRENAISQEAANAFLNETVGGQRQPVEAAFNILCWTDQPGELKNIRNMAGSALAQMEATPRLETVGAAQIWFAGIPGNAGDYPRNDSFSTFLEQASCFLITESNYRDSPSPFGFRVVDRLNGYPLHLDISDLPMRTGLISNRNKAVFGGSGSGKSMLMNHLHRSYYEQGAHVVIVDVGGSYKGLCDLVGGYYFSYTETNPIQFNPFYLSDGETRDTESKESIKTLLLALWKRDDEQFRRSEYVALSNALTDYFIYLDGHPETYPCFNTFYEYLQNFFLDTLKSDKVKEKDFDVDNFLFVLRPYYTGGEYSYLLNAKENLDILHQRFIVFELDNIKDNPILFPVATLTIMQLFISKMRKLKGIRKVITIEEAWKAIAKAGMAEFLKYLYKTVRKFFGEAIVVSQEVDDIISSPIIKDAILNNADCKILLDLRKFQNKFDALQATLGMSDKGKAMVLSLNKANDPKRRYRELFVDLGGMSMKVYGFEPSPEEYYAYTTEESEKVKVMEYAAKYGSIRKGIEMLVADLRK